MEGWGRCLLRAPKHFHRRERADRAQWDIAIKVLPGGVEDVDAIRAPRDLKEQIRPGRERGEAGPRRIIPLCFGSVLLGIGLFPR